jgi:hypothetical protein
MVRLHKWSLRLILFGMDLDGGCGAKVVVTRGRRAVDQFA